MPQSEISTWLNFAMQQMAAESYLHTIDIQDPLQVRPRLTSGNNAPGFPETSFTRFTNQLADRFLSTYQIRDHHSNDSSGFSATLIQKKGPNGELTNEYTLSFRSTEFREQADGGDKERDLQAVGEISSGGFALGQLTAMEDYYTQLKASGKLPPGATLNVTGYSLGGHLATIFTELHAAEISQTYVYNSPGRGQFTGDLNKSNVENLNGMLQYYQGVLSNPDSAWDENEDGSTRAQLYHFAHNASGPIDTTNLYNDPRYQWAVLRTQETYHTFLGSRTTGLGDAADTKITQLYGHATSGDTELVANSGVHAGATQVFIEGQPKIENVLSSQFDFGNTHSIILLVDSLALMELFQQVDSNVTQQNLESVFAASSAAKAKPITFLGDTNAAEGDSLEKALDALRRIFLGPNITPTPLDASAGAFGNISNRNAFYQNIAELQSTLTAIRAADPAQIFTVESLVPTPEVPITATDIANAAQNDNARGLAYRYALKELNPFAVLGANSPQTEALYAQHNVGGALGLESEGGLLTLQYLKDRAEFLEEKVFVDVADAAQSPGTIHFVDKGTNYEITTNADPTTVQVQEFIFGGPGDDDIQGGDNQDRLYGGDGIDFIEGLGANDYIEGNQGNDFIDGGSGTDTVYGGTGDDTIEGGTEDDSLIGGTGNDTLRGGAGYDTYVYRINDNLDTITDSDGQGKIIYDTHQLDGGIRTATDPANTYHGGAQGAMTYVLDGTNLTINNLITVQSFQDGNLGIHLTTAPDTQIPTLQPPSLPTIDFNNGLPVRSEYFGMYTYYNFGLNLLEGIAAPRTLESGENDIYLYDSDPQSGHGTFGVTFGGSFGIVAPDHIFAPDVSPQQVFPAQGDASLNVHLLGGDDMVVAGLGADQLFGDAGNDVLYGATGNDRLFGGADDDTLYGDDGDDLLDGGDGNDRLIGGAGNNVLYGGVGNDNESVAGTGNNYLDGGTGDDTLSGSVGNDTLLGGDGADQLYAADGNDYLDGGEGDDTLSGGAGNDTLLGGEGADQLDAGGGDNLLDGGVGADVLTVTGTGNNTLLGGTGEDQLSGSGGNDVLDGGAGNDTLTGGAGTNVILFGRDSDQDTVDDAGNAQAIDIIQFTGDVAPENVTVRAGDNRGLVLSISGTTDRITLPGFFAASFSPVIQASFADGTVWGAATLTAMAQNVTGDAAGNSLRGTILNDRIAGGIRADTLNGGAGTDTLNGGAGNDIYMFNLGDGVDTIQDTAIPGQGNVLSFGAGIGVTDLTLTQDATRHTLTIQYDTGGDSVQLLNFDPNGVNGSMVAQTLSFADGLQVGLSDLLTVAMGTDGNDVITTGPEDNGIFAKGGDDVVDAGDGDDFVSGGAGNDTLSGGPGDDMLAGGEGDDTYVLHIGDGVDTIFDTWATFGFGDNRILFGDGITQADLTLIQEANTLTITYGADGDAVQLANFDPRLVNGSLVVSALQFADGSQVALGEVAGFLFPGEPMGLPHTFTGTDGADVIAGTAGNDVIDARNGDDVVYADAGRDQVLGRDGDDLLNGGDGDDVLLGGGGNDTLLGGAGNDVLTGDDVIPFFPPGGLPDPGGGPPGPEGPPGPGEGPPAGGRNDLLIGGAGDDLYTFNIGDGVDTIQDTATPGEGNSILFGVGITVTDLTLNQDPFAGTLTIAYSQFGDAIILGNFNPGIPGGLVVQTLAFSDGVILNTADLLAVSQVISGTQDQAVLYGTSGNDLIDPHLLTAYGGIDTVFAGAGNDIVLGGNANDRTFVFGEEGNDTLIGGTGAGMLSGGDGNDTLYIHDSDTIVDGGAGYDTVVVGGTLNLGLASVEAAYGSNGDDVLTTDGPDAITVSGNGGADLLVGGGGNDYLDGGDGNDTLKGSSGNDTLIGGAGNDIYTFNLGDGVDTVQDKSFPGEGNLIVFGNRITSANVTFTQDQTAHTLTLAYGSGGDAVQLSGFDPDGVNGSLVVRVVQFANGSTVSLADLLKPPATDGDDIITGSPGDDVIDAQGGDDVVDTDGGSDTLTGGTGNDTLIGGAGNDTYIFNVSDGVDTIIDTAAAGEGNVVAFGDAITPDSLSLGLGSLLIQYGNQGDAIHITNFDPNNALGTHAIDTFQFADGTVLSYGDLIGRGFDLIGTDGDDVIIGTNVVDRIVGLGGSDTLSGGAGDDTYRFNLGDGVDTIRDVSTVGEGNSIVFGDGITQADLTFSQNQTDHTLTIAYGTGGDAIQLDDFDPTEVGGSRVVETLEFADGSVRNLADLFPRNTTPFVANALADQSTLEDAPFSFAVPANTFADVDAGDTLTYSATQADGSALPGWLAFDAATGTFSGTPTNGDVGSVNVTVMATDQGNLSAADTFALTVVNVNDAPTLAQALADQATAEDAPFSFAVPANTFADVDAGDTLSYSASLENGGALPAWIAFDALTDTFTGTPGNDDVGNVNVTVTAMDQGSLSAADTFVFTVTNVNDAPTLANSIADQSTLEDAAFSFVVPADTFADVDAGDTLTLSAMLADGNPLPAWLAFDTATQSFTGTPGNDDVGSMNVTVTATDSGHLSASNIFGLTVVNMNDAPTVANSIADQTAVEDAPFSFQVSVDTFADVDAGDVLTYNALLVDGNALPGWLGFDAATRTFSGTPSYDEIGTVGITVTATDSGGLNAADTFALTVRIAPDQVVVGSDGDDVLKTSSGNDVIDARGGNDTVTAGRGNDTITGGKGNDLLNGGVGNDTYIYERGDGLDQIADPSGTDTASFGAGISFDTAVARLTTAVGLTTAHLRLLDAGGSELPDEGMDFALDTGGVSPIERFAFANGTTFALSDLVIQTKATQGTNGSDVVRTGRHDDVIEAGNGDDLVYAGTGHDTVYAGNGKDSLYGEGGNDALYGANGEDFLDGGGGNDLLDGGNGKDTLQGGPGDDALDSGNGPDTILFGRGDGQDTMIGWADNQGDAIQFSSGINPIDLVLRRQANDLRVAIHGSDDRMTIQDWYADNANQAKEFEAGSGSQLLNTQVDQLIQAMAQFSSESGLSWDQAIDQRPQDVQTILAANWN